MRLHCVGYNSFSNVPWLEAVDEVEYESTSRLRAACRSNIALFHSGMSSSVCDTCRWGTEDAVAPGGLFSLDVNAPISAPIKGRELRRQDVVWLEINLMINYDNDEIHWDYRHGKMD